MTLEIDERLEGDGDVFYQKADTNEKERPKSMGKSIVGSKQDWGIGPPCVVRAAWNNKLIGEPLVISLRNAFRKCSFSYTLF